jgi:hypothetical protein
VLGDSLLVINQANKEWSCLDDKMMMYYQEFHKLENSFDDLKYYHCLRGHNDVGNELAKLSSSQATIPLWVFMQELHEPSISRALSKANKAPDSSQETTPSIEDTSDSPDAMAVHSDWRTPFMIYLRTGGLTDNKDEHERLQWWA